MDPLTKRQQAIFDFIRDSQDTTGETPSMREMAEHFGFSSPNASRAHIQALIRKGYLRQRPHKARSLEIVSPLRQLRGSVVDIPLFGTIPAGFGDLQEETAEGCISVDVDTLGISTTPRTFALRVRGDSMVGRHVVSGDIVVCERGRTPREGDMVAALIDNESTLKTYVMKGHTPHLRAENPRYPDLVPAAELVIQGVVIAMIRRFASPT